MATMSARNLKLAALHCTIWPLLTALLFLSALLTRLTLELSSCWSNVFFSNLSADLFPPDQTSRRSRRNTPTLERTCQNMRKIQYSWFYKFTWKFIIRKRQSCLSQKMNELLRLLPTSGFSICTTLSLCLSDQTVNESNFHRKQML